ncbi:hypothetical protein ACS0TY_017150 [Phlomoides rotata]
MFDGSLGIGLHNTPHMVDAPEDKWVAWIDRNNNGQKISGASVDAASETPLFNESSPNEFTSSVRGDASSVSNHKSKGNKRLVYDQSDERCLGTVKTLRDKTNEQINELSAHVSELTHRVGSNFDTSEKRAMVYESLSRFDFLTLEDKVNVTQHLCNNPNDLDMFFTFPDGAKAVLVKKIKKT